MTTRYVLGFLFDESLSRIALVRKDHPDWMKGKWNAIGGEVQEDEGINDAMVRECQEEAGIEDTSLWGMFASISGEGFDVFCYRSTTGDIEEAHGREVSNELVCVIPIRQIPSLVLVPDLQWLVHAAITHFHHPGNFIEVKREGNPHLI